MLQEAKIKELLKGCAKLTSYVKNTGLNKKLKPSLKLYTATRWNSVYIMIDAIVKNYPNIYDLLVMKQKLRNDTRLKNKEQPDSDIVELITQLNCGELTECREFLKPFKVFSIQHTVYLKKTHNSALKFDWVSH